MAQLCAWMCASNMSTFWFTCTFCSSRCRILSFLWASSGPGGERVPPATTCGRSPRRRPAQLGLPTPPLLLLLLLLLLLPPPPPLPLLLFNLRRLLRQPPGPRGSSGDNASAGGKRKEAPLPGLKTLPGLSAGLADGGGASPRFPWLALSMITRLLST
jgi:hypothetical protein